MNDIIDTIEYKGFKIDIYVDNDPIGPREWDNLGTMVCQHRDYLLGDVKTPDFGDAQSWDEARQYLLDNNDIAVILNLTLLDHSGLSIDWSYAETNTVNGYTCWDTMQVGFIYITRDKIRKEFNVKRISKKLLTEVEESLKQEVKMYDYYIRGSVYRYVIDGVDVDDSCYGFYGYDYETNGLLESAREAIDWHIESQRLKKIEQTKAYIINRVPLEARL